MRWGREAALFGRGNPRRRRRFSGGGNHGSFRTPGPILKALALLKAFCAGRGRPRLLVDYPDFTSGLPGGETGRRPGSLLHQPPGLGLRRGESTKWPDCEKMAVIFF